MNRLLILLFAASVPAPALAQHQGHTMPMPSGERSAQQPRPAARPQARRSAQRPAPQRVQPRRAAPRQAPPQADPHAGHGQARPSGQPVVPAAPATGQASPADPHAGHVMPGQQAPAAPPDPHAGHDMPGMQAPAGAADPQAGHVMPNAQSQPGPGDPHAGHAMGNMQPAADPPVAPPPPGVLSGPAHAADRVFPGGAMDDARDVFRREHGVIRAHRVLIDLLETRIQDGRDGYAWDAQGWYGGAINRLWIKTEGEGDYGARPERAEFQALYSRALDPWFNLQAGVRYDLRPNPQRGYLVLGVQGLAPYWFEVDGALFLSDRGDLSARFEGEYDLRITQRLILQPRAEVDLALSNDRATGIGSGLSSAEAGLRLRYQIVPEFAPYVGVEYERAFGDTADFRRAAGEDVGGWRLVLGVRTWF